MGLGFSGLKRNFQLICCEVFSRENVRSHRKYCRNMKKIAKRKFVNFIELLMMTASPTRHNILNLLEVFYLLKVE